jgi:hypothetical protein
VNDLRNAAEMALDGFGRSHFWQRELLMDEEAIHALRQALTPEVTPECIYKKRQYFDSSFA